MDETLYRRLEPVVRRIKFRRIWTGLAIVWTLAAVCGAWLLFLNRKGSIDSGGIVWFLFGGTFIASLVAILIAVYRTRSVFEVAETLEQKYPDLDASLVTAIEQRPEPGKRLGFLQQDVLRKAVTHSYTHRWPAVIPGWQVVAAPMAGAIGFVAFVAAMVAVVLMAKPLPTDPVIPFSEAAIEQSNYSVSVEPGNTEVERGTSLLVLARFSEALPPDASLVYTDSDGVQTKTPMSKSLDDPVFGSRIPSVRQPISYYVEFSDRKSESFDVNVFDFPKLDRADAVLNYPAYTEIQPKTIQDFRRINAVEGTTTDLAFYLNKPVASAWLVPTVETSEVGPLELTADDKDPRKMTARVQMDQSKKYNLELIDTDRRQNRTPPKFIFNVLENRVPNLKLSAPGRDVQASPLEEIQLAASAWDDFGIREFGVSFGIAGKDTRDVVLHQAPISKKVEKQKKQNVEFLLELESIKAQPDDLVSFYFWVEDIGPDGQDRRTMSDMSFAEVRHFEDIFRQGQAQPRGQQQQQQQQQQSQTGQAAQELAELQKEIINATWKVIRREGANELSQEFADDVVVIKESQETAIQQLAELAGKVEGEESKKYIEAIRTMMNMAVARLQRAVDDADPGVLTDAMSNEQAAYQGLLKLRAREHEVVRQQQQQSGQASQQQNNRAQEQLEQLNLKEDENRYENQRTAQQQSQQNQQQQEVRQVLSRLRELARRQKDLNQRVKELQSALEEAETPEEKEEIERRLKSLRDQQEQLLRDTEELIERMQSNENQQQMSEESQQLEQTRENQQRSAEALKNLEPSRAAAEGTRAQRDLEELRDEFQNRSAGQFTEQMRQLRNEAQNIEQAQNQIGQALSDQPNTGSKETPTLRDEDAGKPELTDQLAEQEEAVKQLREKMRETIEQAEPFEPLLAEDLYDTYRDSEVSRPDEALESTRRSLDRGWLDDARNEEQRARQGIEQLREGIEKAANNVLGDETQALRAAAETLEGLNRELQQEIDSQNPNQPGEDGNSQGQRSDQQGSNENRQNERSNPREQESQEGQRTTGEGESSDQSANPPAANNGNSRSENEPEDSDSRGQTSSSAGQQRENPQSSPSEGSGSGNDEEQQTSEDEQRSAAEQLRRQMRELGGSERSDDPRSTTGVPQTGGGNQQMMRPISGDDFRDWSDRLRDVEEMVADPDLRAEASRIREKARELRRDMKRHSAKPNWELVKMKVAKPLAELQDRVAEEILRRNSEKALVPLDRDPVPVKFQDAVRKYYERLGSGR